MGNIFERRAFKSGMFKTAPYWQRMNSVFGSALILNPPFNETSGTTAFDKSPQGNNGTYAGVTLANASAPSYIGGKCPTFPGATSQVNFLSDGFIADWNGQEGAIRIPLKVSAAADWNTANLSAFGFQAQNTSNRVFIRTSVGNNMDIYYVAGGTSKSATLAKMGNFTDWLDCWLAWSLSANELNFYVNGVLCEWGKYNSVTFPLTGLGTFITDPLTVATIGTFTARWKGNLAHPLVLNRPVTPTEVRNLNPYGVILFDGDSRTNAKSYPFEAFGASAKTYMGFKHLGTTGAGLSTLTTNAPANVDPWIHGSNNICVIWAGVNDSANTAQQIHDAIKTYCLARRAAGWRVLVCTEIDAQDAGRLANGWTVKYQALNTLLKADYADFADAIADLGANANLQDATNTTYFNADKLHLTTAGYTVVAGIVGAALTGM